MQLIRKNAEVFSRWEFNIGRTYIIEHATEMADSHPVHQALCQHSVAYLPLIDWMNEYVNLYGAT